MKILKLCNLFYGLTRFGGIEWGQPIAPPGKTLSKKHNVLLQNSEILNKIVAKHNIRGKYVGAGAFSVVYSDGVIVTKITPYKEDALYYKLDSAYQLAINSIPSKMEERLNVAKVAHSNLIKFNAETKYKKIVNEMLVRIDKDLQKFIK